VSWIQRSKRLFGSLLVASAAIVGAVGLFLLAVLPAMEWSLGTDASATGMLRRTGVLICVLLAYWGVVRWYERRRADELRVAPANIAVGALSGAALISITSMILFAAGIYAVAAYRGLQGDLLGVAWTIVIAATVEEILFRGVLFLALERACGSVAALWLQSLVFSVLHIANLDDGIGAAEMVMSVLSGTLIGAFWTLVFMLSRNIWVAAANHAAWNFAVVLTGLPRSGLDDWRSLAPFESRYHGPNWLSGGQVGPEDSIITVVLVTIAVLAMALVARRSGKFAVAGQVRD
jgi:membrane protease YdiL (CAAX protease family)